MPSFKDKLATKMLEAQLRSKDRTRGGMEKDIAKAIRKFAEEGKELAPVPIAHWRATKRVFGFNTFMFYNNLAVMFAQPVFMESVLVRIARELIRSGEWRGTK